MMYNIRSGATRCCCLTAIVMFALSPFARYLQNKKYAQSLTLTISVMVKEAEVMGLEISDSI